MQILGALESPENHKAQLQDGVISPWGLFSATGETLQPWIRENFPLEQGTPTLPSLPELWGCLGAGCEGAAGQARLHTQGCWGWDQPSPNHPSAHISSEVPTLAQSPVVQLPITSPRVFSSLPETGSFALGPVGANGDANPLVGSWESSNLPSFHWEGRGARGGSLSVPGRSSTVLFLGPVEICLF